MTPVRDRDADAGGISKVKDYGTLEEELTPRFPPLPPSGGGAVKEATKENKLGNIGATVVTPATPTPAAAPPPRRQRSDSVATFNGGGAESIFRLLPRETRPALRRMLFVEPSARCTLTDLLKGKGKTSGLLCGCQGHGHGHEGTASDHSSINGGVDAPPGGHCEDHDCDPGEEDDGDEWLKSIVPCSGDGAPDHVHIKVAVDQKHKRRFF